MTTPITVVVVPSTPHAVVVVPPPQITVVPAGQGLQGVRGPAGPDGQGQQGPIGPAGPPGGATYDHVQSTPAAVWSVTHGLSRYPTVVVLDSTGSLVDGDVDYIDADNITLTFSGAFSGKAFFN